MLFSWLKILLPLQDEESFLLQSGTENVDSVDQRPDCIFCAF